MLGPHASIPNEIQAAVRRIVQAVGDRQRFFAEAAAAIERFGTEVDRKDAAQIIDSWWRCRKDDIDAYRRNLGTTLERMRNGWPMNGPDKPVYRDRIGELAQP